MHLFCGEVLIRRVARLIPAPLPGHCRHKRINTLGANLTILHIKC